MTHYYTSDWHLGHARIRELCDRPFPDVETMNEAIVDGVNSTLNPRVDILWVLGDVCMGTMEDSLTLLGRIRANTVVLIPGNHDRWSLAYPTKGDHWTKRRSWQDRYSAALSGVETRFVMTDREPSYWWTSIRGHRAFVSHYPYEGDSHDEDRYTSLRPPSGLGFLVHGHVHNAWQTSGRQFNVGVDVNGFKPVSDELLADWITTQLSAEEGSPTVDGWMEDTRKVYEQAFKDASGDERTDNT